LVSDAQNKAAIGIRKKIQGMQNQFSGSTFLGELSETIHMIRNPALALRELTGTFLESNLKRRLKKKPKKVDVALAESWLEFSFGVKPLINDIATIAEAALQTFDDDRILRLSYTGHAETASSSVTSNGAGPGFSGVCNYSRDDSTKVSYRYLIGYRHKATGCDDALLNVINASRIFDPSTLIPTAWELLPWSFFIDYFSNIGDCISTSLVSTQDVVWVNRTMRQQKDIHVHSGNAKWDSIAVGNQVLTEFVPPSYIARCEIVQRSAGDIPFGTVSFALPGKSSQFLNLAALARLQFPDKIENWDFLGNSVRNRPKLKLK